MDSAGESVQCEVQTPGDGAGSGPDRRNKANSAVKQVTQILGFPDAYKNFMCTLDCSLLSVQ